MYSSSYSRAKFGLEAREPLRRSKGKSCGYYMRIIFFFSSLIQSLIIVSLVLFIVYGQPEKTSEEMRIEDLEMGFRTASNDNVRLTKEKGELGTQLKARTEEKAALEKDLEKVKADANKTEQNLKTKISTLEKNIASMSMMARRPAPPVSPPVSACSGELRTLQALNTQQKAMINHINSNFTYMVHYLSQERDSAQRERDVHLAEAVELHRNNSLLREQFVVHSRKCKQDFANSLVGIETVTRNFLNRIESLFPHQLTFHLNCRSQQLEMERIKNSCTNLSRDVESKFQVYLDNVGNKVAEIQARSSQMEVLNERSKLEMKECEERRKEIVANALAESELKQKAHDDKVEKLLLEQKLLREQKERQEERLTFKDKEIQTLQANCKASSLPKVSPQLGAPQPGGQTAANTSSSGTSSSSKTQTVG